MTPQELTPLLKLAKEATTSKDATKKWASNAELLSWFRSDPVAVILALQAAAHVSACPGGLNHTRLHTTISKLPKLEVK
jgi:hypothetical protein